MALNKEAEPLHGPTGKTTGRSSKPFASAIINEIIIYHIGCSSSSCSNPGYGTHIYISKDAGATETAIKVITSVLRHRCHDEVMIKEESPWKVESYKINLDEKLFGHFEHRYIRFVVEYYFSGETIDGHEVLDKIEVRIGNHWEGRNPILKELLIQS